MSFHHYDGSICSVLVSKDEKKLRLQSVDLAHMSLLLKELLSSVELKHSSRSLQEVISFQDTLPTQELFDTIDEHFRIRDESKNLMKALEKRTVQLRMIQKRLLNRFKDKNPSPLNNLDFLLNHTYNQIIDMAL